MLLRKEMQNRRGTSLRTKELKRSLIKVPSTSKIPSDFFRQPSKNKSLCQKDPRSL